ncbi:MAG: dTDP-4-dehydrorhamnose reductase [Clostridia bacterium]|nr:dTDP-4-dehydrorhamnose reductase [Clostridia bacterium]
MKILITGAKGQLGQELIGILKSGRAEIGAISESYAGALVTAADIEDFDITDLKSTRSFIENAKPDIIINCAAMTNVDGCETAREAAFSINAAGVRNLAVCAKEAGAKFIQISTDYVFSGSADRPYCEWDVIAPKSVYGASKALGEKYALSFCDKTFIIRTSWLYGYEGKNFVKTVRRVLREKGKITVVDDQRGNPTGANDLAYHILKLALTGDYGIYHCTGEGECSWYEFAREIARLSGYGEEAVIPCTSKEYNSPANRPAYSCLDNLALRAGVGNEMRDWRIALGEFISKVKD